MKRSVLMLGLALVSGAPTVAGAIEKGHELAQKLCARCHAIDPDAPWNSLGSTPSFMLMAKKMKKYEPRILTVTKRRPHIGQRLSVSEDDLKRILAYIRSLKRN